MKTHVNVVCVKTGNKYDRDRVERLYNMVERNCSLPFSFYCLTDDKDISWKFKPIPLDVELDLESYWWKISLFNLRFSTPTIYFDLDIVIQNNFDYIFDMIKEDKILAIKPDDAGISRENDIFLYNDSLINTSILGFIPQNHKDVFTDFTKDTDYHIAKYYGLDRFLSDKFLNKFNYLDFNNDYYYRWKNDSTPEIYCDKNGLAHDPRKTFCLICQEQSHMYVGLEKYFL